MFVDEGRFRPLNSLPTHDILCCHSGGKASSAPPPSRAAFLDLSSLLGTIAVAGSQLSFSAPSYPCTVAGERATSWSPLRQLMMLTPLQQ